MCWKRCTDKKWLDSEWFEEEIVFKYPDGSTKQIDQRCGEGSVGTINFDEDGNEMQFKSSNERLKWITRQSNVEYERKMELLDPEYSPKNIAQSVEILQYQAEEMRLHDRVEELEKIRINLLGNENKWNDLVDVKWKELNFKLGYSPTAKDKKMHDNAMAQVRIWEERAKQPMGKEEISQAELDARVDAKKFKQALNIIEPPEGSPEIKLPKYNYEGEQYDFAKMHSDTYYKMKEKSGWEWAKNRLTYFRWLRFQWDINGEEFIAEKLQSSLTTGKNMYKDEPIDERIKKDLKKS